MKSLELTETDVIPSLDEVNTKYFVTLKGSLTFCKNAVDFIGDKAEIKTILTKQKKSELVKQSTVELSLKQYLLCNYVVKSDIDKQVLLNEINRRI